MMFLSNVSHFRPLLTWILWDNHNDIATPQMRFGRTIVNSSSLSLDSPFPSQGNTRTLVFHQRSSRRIPTRRGHNCSCSKPFCFATSRRNCIVFLCTWCCKSFSIRIYNPQQNLLVSDRSCRDVLFPMFVLLAHGRSTDAFVFSVLIATVPS